MRASSCAFIYGDCHLDDRKRFTMRKEKVKKVNCGEIIY